ncbi:hypothetical protein [Pararhizobium haloflavum]|uniref:hypothetical protein n=1 Tax=Pararhizobium haloflavum TaxID=2037914 RepID=UPI0013001612|nr:hypothetical protein [Pararhizobium haloflavum]
MSHNAPHNHPIRPSSSSSGHDATGGLLGLMRPIEIETLAKLGMSDRQIASYLSASLSDLNAFREVSRMGAAGSGSGSARGL